MGARGPKPAPTVLKLLRGETRPSRVNHAEPTLPPPSTLSPPPTLKGAGLREWLRLVGSLSTAGVLTDGDMSLFEDFCRALSDLRRCEAKAARLGLERAIATGVQGTAIKLRAQVTQLRAHLGLTPSSRSGIRGTVKPPVSKLDSLLSRRRG